MRLSSALACSLSFASRPSRAQGMGNPATINCIDQNFTDQTLYAHNGGQYGICIFSNTTACDEWAFFRSECNTTNPNFSVYCTDKGGEVIQENVDWGEVEGAPPATYGMCTSEGEQCSEFDYYAYNNCSFSDPILGQPTNGCMGSPDGCYCSDNGYTMSPPLYQSTGGQYALCIFSNSTACDSWTYFRGECNETNPNFQAYCADNGGALSMKSVDWGDVAGELPAKYEVCTTDGVECTENDYYTTQCNQVETSVTESPSPAITAIGDAMSVTAVPKGGSAQIDCQDGSYCCTVGSYDSVSGNVDFGGCDKGVKVTSGVATNCDSDDCDITCTGACDVKVVGDAGAVETPAGPSQPPDSPSPQPSGSNAISHGVVPLALVVISLQQIFGALV